MSHLFNNVYFHRITFIRQFQFIIIFLLFLPFNQINVPRQIKKEHIVFQITDRFIGSIFQSVSLREWYLPCRLLRIVDLGLGLLPFIDVRQ